MTDNDLTPKDFAPHLLAVLGELTEYQANVSVPMTETYSPVCARMSIDEDYNGETEAGYKFTHRNIGLAFRQHIRGKGLGEQVKKGVWMLTPYGIDVLRKNIASNENSEMTEDPLNLSRLDEALTALDELKHEQEDAEILPFPTIRDVHPYSDDPYILSLAIESVPCFGAWSNRSDSCKTCLIASDCLVQVGVVKGKLAARLESEEIENKRRILKENEEKEKNDSSVSELINAFNEDIHAFDKDKSDSPSTSKKKKFKPQPGQTFEIANASRNSVCMQCRETIPVGTKVQWAKGEGLFHLECFEESPIW